MNQCKNIFTKEKYEKSLAKRDKKSKLQMEKHIKDFEKQFKSLFFSSLKKGDDYIDLNHIWFWYKDFDRCFNIVKKYVKCTKGLHIYFRHIKNRYMPSYSLYIRTKPYTWFEKWVNSAEEIS